MSADAGGAYVALLRWVAGDGWPLVAGMLVGLLADSLLSVVLASAFAALFTYFCDVYAPSRLRRTTPAASDEQAVSE